jgi:hypothetical protein
MSVGGVISEMAERLVTAADEIEGVSTTGGFPAWATQFLVTVAASLVIAMVIGVWKSGTKRLDQLEHQASQLANLQGTAKAFVGAVDGLRAEIRALRVDTLTRSELVRVAQVLHPDRDLDELANLIGEHPPLTVEQARGIARHRAQRSGPDNPEVHP